MTDERPDRAGTAAPTARESTARILVIDDEEVVHVSLQRMLGRRGHEVRAVFSAQEGLELLGAGGFDLVITDLMMPEMDGIALLKALKRREVAVPALMITGYPTIRTALQALRLGAVDYVAKPFTRQELLGPISRALHGGEAAAAPGAGRSITAEVRAATASVLGDDGIEAPKVDVAPGQRFHLPRHSWAVFQQDGSMEVGIERVFLASIGAPAAVELPSEAQLVEQGYVGIKLRTAAGEEHGVLMPVSGPVVAVNEEAAGSPSMIDHQTWLVRIIPSRLDRELPVLVRSPPPSG